MLRRSLFLYFMVFSLVFFLALPVWQSARYMDLERQIRTLEADQEKWVEDNRKIIADIASLTSAENVEAVAIYELGLKKIEPENVLQVWIERR